MKILILALLSTMLLFTSCGDDVDYGFKDQVATGKIKGKTVTFKSGAIDGGENMMVRLYNRVIEKCSLNDIMDPRSEYIRFHVPRKVGVYEDIDISLTAYEPEQEYEYQGQTALGIVEITKINEETKEVEGKINIEISSDSYFNGKFSFTGCN